METYREYRELIPYYCAVAMVKKGEQLHNLSLAQAEKINVHLTPRYENPVFFYNKPTHSEKIVVTL